MHLLQNLQASERAICQIWSALVERNNEGKDITKLIMDYTREAKTRDSLLKTLINAYESEISRLKMEGSHDQLSKRQKSTIREEMKVLERLCDTKSGMALHKKLMIVSVHTFLKNLQKKFKRDAH